MKDVKNWRKRIEKFKEYLQYPTPFEWVVRVVEYIWVVWFIYLFYLIVELILDKL